MILFIAAILCGCGDDSSDGKKEKIQVNKLFPKIEDHGMELNIISTLASYRIGDPNPTMKFQFINEGLAVVRIPEWKIVELANLKVQYAECPVEESAEKLPESAWKDSPRTIPSGDCPRYPLELEPKSSVIISVPLSFIKELKSPGRYAVRGVIDLTSMDLKSSPRELIIR